MPRSHLIRRRAWLVALVQAKGPGALDTQVEQSQARFLSTAEHIRLVFYQHGRVLALHEAHVSPKGTWPLGVSGIRPVGKQQMPL